MTLPNIFSKEVLDNVLQRIDKLKPSTQPQWGKMSVAQMLAHCCVSYEMAYEDKPHPKPNFLMKLFLKAFVKETVCGKTPYKKNLRTAPAFLITNERNFENEKSRLIGYLKKTQELGEEYFDNRESHSFGHLSKDEWNNMFYKHIDHHLSQFGV